MSGSRRVHWAIMFVAASTLVIGGCADDAGDDAASATAGSAVATSARASASGASATASPSIASPSIVSPSSPGSQSSDESAETAQQRKVSELRTASDEVLALLASQDYEGLAKRVHPSQGVRFTPYLTVDTEGDVMMTPAQVAELGSNKKLYSWGADPGSGEVIRTTFADYAERFITNLDYASAPVVSENKRVSSGSSLDNVAEAYPNSQFVEYYFPGFDPQYGGMDWQSQRLVFAEHDGRLYLVGIVHDSWTP